MADYISSSRPHLCRDREEQDERLYRLGQHLEQFIVQAEHIANLVVAGHTRTVDVVGQDLKESGMSCIFSQKTKAGYAKSKNLRLGLLPKVSTSFSQLAMDCLVLLDGN